MGRPTDKCRPVTPAAHTSLIGLFVSWLSSRGAGGKGDTWASPVTLPGKAAAGRSGFAVMGSTAGVRFPGPGATCSVSGGWPPARCLGASHRLQHAASSVITARSRHPTYDSPARPVAATPFRRRRARGRRRRRAGRRGRTICKPSGQFRSRDSGSIRGQSWMPARMTRPRTEATPRRTTAPGVRRLASVADWARRCSHWAHIAQTPTSGWSPRRVSSDSSTKVFPQHQQTGWFSLLMLHRWSRHRPHGRPTPPSLTTPTCPPPGSRRARPGPARVHQSTDGEPANPSGVEYIRHASAANQASSGGWVFAVYKDSGDPVIPTRLSACRFASWNVPGGRICGRPGSPPLVAGSATVGPIGSCTPWPRVQLRNDNSGRPTRTDEGRRQPGPRRAPAREDIGDTTMTPARRAHTSQTGSADKSLRDRPNSSPRPDS